MEFRNLWQKVFGGKTQPATTTGFEFINSPSTSFYAWNGNLFDSDIVRSAIRPKATRVGKLNAKHIVGYGEDMKVNSVAWIKEILEQPNPFMSMQDFLMKMTYQRELTHNAFAYVRRDNYGRPLEVYPIPYSAVEMVESGGMVFVKFRFYSGKQMTVPYEDVIHLRKDFNSNDFYGDDGKTALSNIMEVINTTDQGIVNAIKNSAIIKWILMFKHVLQPKDIKQQVKDFVKNYMSIEKGAGAAVSDPNYELKQVEDKNIIPNSMQMEKSIQRLYSYFGANDAIVQNKANENEENDYYENEIEPIVIQLTNAFTRAFFSRLERSLGNRIVFEAVNLAYASMATKLGLVAMVDRGSMTPNEWRLVLNLAPIVGGDAPLRRLDTITVDEADKTDKTKTDDNSVDNLADTANKDEEISQVSLNGAQIQGLLAIVQSVIDGVLEYDAAVELIVAAFPFDKDIAEKILGDKTKKKPKVEEKPADKTKEDNANG